MEYRTYEDACAAVLPRTQAHHFVVNEHGASWFEFETEYGRHDHYQGQDVLDFLGY